MCVYIGTCVCGYSSSFSSLLPPLQAASAKASGPSRRDSSDHGCHVVGGEEAQFVVQAASPPGRVGAIQDLNHLSRAEPQLVLLEGLKVVQRPGPPHSLLGENRGVPLNWGLAGWPWDQRTEETLLALASRQSPPSAACPEGCRVALQRHLKPRRR